MLAARMAASSRGRVDAGRRERRLGGRRRRASARRSAESVSSTLRVRLEHLGQRPVADAVAVGEAAAAHDVRRRRRGLEPREQLADEAALADAGLAVERHEMRAPLVDDAPVGRGQQLELALAADERRARARERALGDRLLGEQLDGAQRLGLARAPRARCGGPKRKWRAACAVRSATSTWPGLGGLLEPRGGVDGVAGRERLARAAASVTAITEPVLMPIRSSSVDAVALAERRR